MRNYITFRKCDGGLIAQCCRANGFPESLLGGFLVPPGACSMDSESEERQGENAEVFLRSDERLPSPVLRRKRGPPDLEKVTENGEAESDAGEGEGEEERGEESSSDSSDSGSSNTSTTSTGTTSSNTSTPVVRSVLETDEFGQFMNVSCNSNEARFYLNRFSRGSVGRCVLFRGRWITPNEFQAISGRQSSKDWKRSIRLKGRCLKEYIAQGLFQEHPKSCSCKVCGREDVELLRQEGEMALAAKRRRLSQADSVGPSAPQPAEEGEEKPPVKRKRGRPPKRQKVWSPSGEVAQEGSSNDEDQKPVIGGGEGGGGGGGEDPETPIIDMSDFTPRRSRRSIHRKHTGHRTELGTFTRKPRDWDVEEVTEFLQLQGFSDLTTAFQESEIDGDSLFLLQEHHLIEKFQMKLGPALKLLDLVSRLKHPPIQ